MPCARFATRPGNISSFFPVRMPPNTPWRGAASDRADEDDMAQARSSRTFPFGGSPVPNQRRASQANPAPFTLVRLRNDTSVICW